jgi:hypothetical protein
MESNRLNITKQRAPTVILSRKVFDGIIGEKGQCSCLLTVLGQKLETDDNGNEVLKFTLKISNTNKTIIKEARS